MKRLLSVIVLLTCFFNCEDRNQFKTIPLVIALSSATGSAGQEITITGKHFSENTDEIVVLFGEVPAIIKASTSTTITVIIPENQNEVKVIVAVDKLVARNKPDFTYMVPVTPDIPVTNPEEEVLKPVVTSISPSSGLFGITITIDGENFSTDKSQNLVSFNGVPAVVQDATPTKLTVTVPGSSTGPVSVTVNGNKAINEPVFTYLNTPTVTSIAPASGLAGTTVTIIGTNFSTDKSQNTVSFYGVVAVVQSATSTQLTVTVPTSSTGPVVVSVNGNMAANRPVFTYPPTVTVIAPSSGLAGITITITGTNFSTTKSQNVVSFNGVAATVQTATSTKLTVIAPVSSTGPVSVTVNGIKAVNEPVFTYHTIPTVTHLTPAAGSVGSLITINGTNFSTIKSENEVRFNGISAVVQNATSTALIVTVPTSSTGPVTVVVNGNMAVNEPVFTYRPVPTVTSISPATGLAGEVITIRGTNFSAINTENTVSFNGVAAVVQSATSTLLTVTVPASSTGPVTVNVNGSKAVHEPMFIYLDAEVTGIWPAVGLANTETEAKIYGIYFGTDPSQISVTISGQAAEIVSVTNSRITIKTPIDNSSGPVIVTVRNKQAKFPSNVADIESPYFTYYQPTCNAELIITNYIVSGNFWEGQLSNIGSQSITVTGLTAGSHRSVNSIFDDADDVWCYGISSAQETILPGQTIEISSSISLGCMELGHTLFPLFKYNASDIAECDMTNNHGSVLLDW